MGVNSDDITNAGEIARHSPRRENDGIGKLLVAHGKLKPVATIHLDQPANTLVAERGSAMTVGSNR